jgi:O-antigen/teichoic acid export membrane protein
MRAFRMLLVLLIVAAVIALLFIKPAVYLMYGSEFLPLVLPFLILIPGIVMSGASTPFMSYFMSINRPDLSVTLPIFPLAVQVALALLIIPTLGAAGAALAFSTGLVAFSLISCWKFLKLSGCTFRSDLMVRREDLSYLWHLSTAEAGKIWMAMKSIRTQTSHFK